MAKRLLCVVLSLLMIMAVLPAGVVAEETTFDSSWTELTAGGSLESGNYYLTGDLTLTTDITIPEGETVVIDLNGYVLTGTKTKYKPTILINGTLTLQDSGGTGKVVGGGTESAVIAVQGSSSDSLAYFTLESGTITGGTGGSNGYNGGGVCVNGNAQFTMNGGTITGNRATNGYGGGVYVVGNNLGSATSKKTSSFIMNGGTITGNSSNYAGGGVAVRNSNSSSGIKSSDTWSSYISVATFTMNGGTISNNTVSGSVGGGGIYAETAKITITNGTITGNKATYSGGGIYANMYCSVTISNSTITSNISVGTVKADGITPTGGLGGGIYFGGKYSYIKIASSDIYGNSSGYAGDDLYVNDKVLTTYGGGFSIQSSPVTTTSSLSCGHTITGWYTDATSARWSCDSPTSKYTTYTSAAAGLSLKAAHGTIVTLSYDANGGTGTIASESYESGSTATVASGDGLTYDGYTFSGWNTASDGSGTTYAAGDTFAISADTTLYAVWTKTLDKTWVSAYNVYNGSSLAMGFYIPTSKMTDASQYTVRITITYGGTYGSYVAGKSSYVDYTSGSGYWSTVGDEYFIEFHNIMAYQMTDDISIDILDSNGDKVCDTYTTCIREYEEYYINNYGSSSSEYQLAYSILLYGAEAQTKYTYNTDDSADQNITSLATLLSLLD